MLKIDSYTTVWYNKNQMSEVILIGWESRCKSLTFE